MINKRILQITLIITAIALLFSCILSNSTDKSLTEDKVSTRSISYPIWDGTSVFAGGSRVIHNEHLWESKWWNQGKEPGGETDTAGVWDDLGEDGGSSAEPVILLDHNFNGELKATFYKDKEDEISYSGRIILENPNLDYKWNESYFTLWDIQFNTTSIITDIRSSNGSVISTKDSNITTIDLGWQSLIGYGESVELIYSATKQGDKIYPTDFNVNYVRGNKNQMYPEYKNLPASFVKDSQSYTVTDLIANETEYYSTTPETTTGNFIIYTPDSDTQVKIGQTTITDYDVNTVSNVKIWIPSKFMAMGIATVYEFFKINPNYMVALGTKENFSAGVVPPEAGVTMNPVVIDGLTYYWPMVMGHVDGPYQQEVGNFNDAKKYYVDYLGEEAKHTDFTQIMSQNDPKWISATISSGLSISVTRETLAAVKGTRYNDFITTATDPWSEFAIVTYAYNRGVSMFFSKKLFTENRLEALSAIDIPSSFDMGGFGSHVPTVEAITQAMNSDTSDIYDSEITWADMESYLLELKKFYAKGTPSDIQWNNMVLDVQKAYNNLSIHWGGTHVSYRFDFLTLLRVAKEHLPEINPRPTGNQWYYIIKNAKP